MAGRKEFEIEKEKIRAKLNEFTIKAFRILPELRKPRILDMGCGSGIPTLELSKLSNGQITAVDIDEHALEQLREKVNKAGLIDRIHIIKASMTNLDLPETSFDLIWGEGSIAFMGFEKGLIEWSRYLKPGGFLVIHDEKGDISNKIRLIESTGSILLDHFTLSAETWWMYYFEPLERLVVRFREQSRSRELQSLLRKEQREIEMVKSDPSRSESVFFIIQKKTRKPHQS